MSSIIHFKRKLNSLTLEQIKQRAAHSWLSSQTMPTETVDALVAEVERLRHELHDEQVRRDEWENMYNQAIAEHIPDTQPREEEIDPCEGCGNQGSIGWMGNNPGSGNDLCHACGTMND